MARLFMRYGLLLCVLFTLLVSVSRVVARQDSALLIYTGAVVTRRNPIATDVYLMDIDRQIAMRWLRVEHGVGRMLFDADGRLLMWICPDNQACDLALWDNQQLVRVTDNLNTHEMYPAWSPDGRLAYWACVDRLCDLSIWDGHETITLIQSQSLEYSNIIDLSEPAWSRDGRLALAPCDAEMRCDILIWDGITLQNITNTPNRSEIIGEWSHDGRLAYSSCDLNHFNCDIVVWDDSNFVSVTDDFEGSKFSTIWNEVGELAFISCEHIQLCDVMLWDGNTVHNITQTADETEVYPYWINGDTLAFTRDCQSLTLWDGTGFLTFAVEGLCVRGGGVWNANQQFAYAGCASSVEAFCDVMLWDAGQVTRLTHTPYRNEYPMVWLP